MNGLPPEVAGIGIAMIAAFIAGSIAYFAPSSTSYVSMKHPYLIYNMVVPQNMYPFLKTSYLGDQPVDAKLIGLEE